MLSLPIKVEKESLGPLPLPLPLGLLLAFAVGLCVGEEEVGSFVGEAVGGSVDATGAGVGAFVGEVVGGSVAATGQNAWLASV